MNAHQIPAVMDPRRWLELRPETIAVHERPRYKQPRQYEVLNDDGSVGWWTAKQETGRWWVEQEWLGDPVFQNACPRLCAPREGLWRTSSHCG
jgi:hypothetical protein